MYYVIFTPTPSLSSMLHVFCVCLYIVSIKLYSLIFIKLYIKRKRFTLNANAQRKQDRQSL